MSMSKVARLTHAVRSVHHGTISSGVQDLPVLSGVGKAEGMCHECGIVVQCGVLEEGAVMEVGVRPGDIP